MPPTFSNLGVGLRNTSVSHTTAPFFNASPFFPAILNVHKETFALRSLISHALSRVLPQAELTFDVRSRKKRSPDYTHYDHRTQEWRRVRSDHLVVDPAQQILDTPLEARLGLFQNALKAAVKAISKPCNPSPLPVSLPNTFLGIDVATLDKINQRLDCQLDKVKMLVGLVHALPHLHPDDKMHASQSVINEAIHQFTKGNLSTSDLTHVLKLITYLISDLPEKHRLCAFQYFEDKLETLPLAVQLGVLPALANQISSLAENTRIETFERIEATGVRLFANDDMANLLAALAKQIPFLPTDDPFTIFQRIGDKTDGLSSVYQGRVLGVLADIILQLLDSVGPACFEYIENKLAGLPLNDQAHVLKNLIRPIRGLSPHTRFDTFRRLANIATRLVDTFAYTEILEAFTELLPFFSDHEKLSAFRQIAHQANRLLPKLKTHVLKKLISHIPSFPANRTLRAVRRMLTKSDSLPSKYRTRVLRRLISQVLPILSTVNNEKPYACQLIKNKAENLRDVDKDKVLQALTSHASYCIPAPTPSAPPCCHQGEDHPLMIT